MKFNSRWVSFAAITAFAFYWTANLLLWFPWSISTTLGMTLMLTVAPVLWGYGTYLSLKTYQSSQLLVAAISISVIYITIAVVADYIFFGIIRNAMEDLYHPTTFYGYIFLVCLPFIELLLLSKQLKTRRSISSQDFIKSSVLGAISLLAIIIIIKFNITI